ncbi:MAG: alpha/beta hydrolase [Deltaproteobacteria bacterium]|nr:alpha/beta hydrolase [Deltaproteobacteria bacterium]
MRIAKIILAIAVLIVIAAVGFVYLAPESAVHLLVNAMRAQAGLDRKEIRLPDGLRYVYLEGGQGAPLMLLHGFGANKDNFILVAGFLTKHYRVIIPDHIGFGESSHPADADYSPPAQARRLRSFAHALGLTGLHIGGNSMGGHIAMTYAALYPGDVKSLWLLDPSGVWSAPKGMVRTAIETTGKNPLMVKTEEDFATLMQWVMSKPPFAPRPILNVLARERIANYTLEERIFREITADSVEPRVTGLTVPALIVWGGEDRVLHPESAKILNRLMPRSRVILMPKTGHTPMFENPQQSARDYLTFRASLQQ